MTKVIKQILSFTLAVVCIVSLIPLNVLVDEAHAATHTVWVKSIPQIYLEHKSNGEVWLHTASNISNSKFLGKYSDLKKRPTVNVTGLNVVTNYYDPVYVFAFDSSDKAGVWQGGIRFSSLRARPGITSTPRSIVNGKSGSSYVGEGYANGGAWDVSITKGKSGRQVAGSTSSSTSASVISISSGWTEYKIGFTLYTSDIPAAGRQIKHTVLTWFTYSYSGSGGDPWSSPEKPKPTDPPVVEPDPPEPPVWPEPEPQVPSKAGATAQINIPANTYSNYKYLAGNLTASAAAYDKSTYNDYGELDSLSIDLSTNFGNNSNSNSSKSVSTSVEYKNIDSKLLNKLIRVNPVQFDYTGTAVAKTVLTNGSSYTYTLDGARGRLTLQNQKPSTKISLQTLYMGNRVPVGYYYTDTNTDLNVVFDDFENDKKQVIFYVAKKDSWESKKVEFVYTRDNIGKEDYFIRDDLFEFVTEPIKSINRFSGQIKFKEPGKYVLYSQVIDMTDESMAKYLRDSAEDTFNGSGNTQYIEVRPKPAPPTAIISSPPYAFEDEPFTVTQASTDPNNDIVSWVWKNPVDINNGAEVQSNLKNAGEAGGTVTFPSGSAHNEYRIELTVTDATGLTDTAEQIIKVISNVPVAVIKPAPDPDGEVDPTNPDKDPTNPDNPGGPQGNGNAYVADLNNLKENRRIVLTAEDSIAPKSDGIKWNEAKWEFKAISGGSDSNIHNEISSDRKKVTLQFDKPGVYEAKITLSNNFTEKNPDHEDLQASIYSVRITVVPDENPISSLEVTSDNPSMADKTHTITFKVTANSPDQDLLPTNGNYAKKTYNWEIYEDKTGNNEWELVQESRRTYSASHTEVSINVNYTPGVIPKLKAVVTTTETFGQPYEAKFLTSGWKRFDTQETVTEVNWKPDIILTPSTPGTGPEDDPNYPGDPTDLVEYEDTDLDGDGKLDGKFIRIYEKDPFYFYTTIFDELPESCVISWELSKKTHSGEFVNTQESGGKWLSSKYVKKQLLTSLSNGNKYNNMTISLPGIYKLTATVKDTGGQTNTCSIFIRVYSLPIGKLESNNMYIYDDLGETNNGWVTKENIRFDIRSNPTIVDDEWGVAWHQMDWSKDSWSISGTYSPPADGYVNKDHSKKVKGQPIDASEIHFMNEDYSGKSSVGSIDGNVYSETNSRLGFAPEEKYLVDIVLVPGLYGSFGTGDKANILDMSDINAFYTAASNLVTKLESLDSRYDVKLYDSPAVFTGYQSKAEVTTTDNFGQSDSKYASLKLTYTNTDKPNAGDAYMLIDVASMTSTSSTAEVGILQVNKNTGEASTELNGKVKIYARIGNITDENGYLEEPNSWVLLGEYSDKDNLQDKQVTLKKIDDTSWRVSGLSGETFTCNASNKLQLKATYEITEPANTIILNGKSGIIENENEYEKKTDTITIQSALEKVKLREGSLKLVIYATKQSNGNKEFNWPTPDYGDTFTSLRNYVIKNKIHFFTVIPSELATPVINFFEDRSSDKPNTPYPGMNYTPGLSFVSTSLLDVNVYFSSNLYDYIYKEAKLGENTNFRSCSFTEPGLYAITYKGTNFGGKETQPVSYYIKVVEDLAPQILDYSPESPYKRNWDDTKKLAIANVSLSGIMVTSIDGDYIDYTDAKVVWDSNNNKEFTDSTDTIWKLVQGTGNELTSISGEIAKLLKYSIVASQG